MRTLSVILATCLCLYGLVTLVYAASIPSGYDLRGASALQISQVYDTGTYYGVMAVAAFAGAGVLARAFKDDD